MSGEQETIRYPESLEIAVLIPCYNEAQTLGKVIDDFRAQLPQATIYVFDNNSTDESADIARQKGATVCYESRQGKGFVVEAMFQTVEADLYVMVDGDDTYPAEQVHRLIEPVLSHRADMAVGSRLDEFTDRSFRPCHVLGNKLVRLGVNLTMRTSLTDILSGYRVFNRTIASLIPVVSGGFEIETELTIQTLYYHRQIVEVPVPYRNRPEGSASKLNTFRDGFRVLWKLFSLFRNLKPLTFFGGAGLVVLFFGLLVGSLPIRDYLVNPNHEVVHLPSAVLAGTLVLLSVISGVTGLLLHALNWRLREIHNVMTRRSGGRP